MKKRKLFKRLRRMEAGIMTGISGFSVKTGKSSHLIVWGSKEGIGIFVAYNKMALKLTVQIGTLIEGDTKQ